MPSVPTGPIQARHPGHGVDPRFVQRWSPRAFASTPVPREVLESMAEAARWAPSSSNLQPWHYIIGQGPARDAWNGLLKGFNREWAPHAPVLVWVTARRSLGPESRHTPGAPNRHAWFDTGAATMQLILEAERHGLRCHTMGGIETAEAHAALGLDDDHDVVCAIAVGYPGDPAALPEPLRVREVPSGRKPFDRVATFV